MSSLNKNSNPFINFKNIFLFKKIEKPATQPPCPQQPNIQFIPIPIMSHHDYSWGMDSGGGWGMNSWGGMSGLSRSSGGSSDGWSGSSSSGVSNDNIGSSSNNALSLYTNFLSRRIRKY